MHYGETPAQDWVYEDSVYELGRVQEAMRQRPAPGGGYSPLADVMKRLLLWQRAYKAGQATLGSYITLEAEARRLVEEQQLSMFEVLP